MTASTVNARISPRGGLDVLSRSEVSRLRDASTGGLHELLRRCALAVLTSGSQSDDPRAALERYPDFDIQVQQQDRGIKLELSHAPSQAFVDGQIIAGVAELLFAVVRDIAYVSTEIQGSGQFDLEDSQDITNAVFEILRNARILRSHMDPNLVVCWGGHSIGREEYLYTKSVGYELGLRGLDICTGCGPGAMKGPMKGATIAHAKQRRRTNRYIGITEPGIIAAESPNPIVNHLVIMPDIEKRLEAFVRIGHGIIVFHGGVGTAEEILYLLGILLHPENQGTPFPLCFTGPHQ
jgi:predicted Rossmann-fold nucleotide-binding protein